MNCIRKLVAKLGAQSRGTEKDRAIDRQDRQDRSTVKKSQKGPYCHQIARGEGLYQTLGQGEFTGTRFDFACINAFNETSLRRSKSARRLDDRNNDVGIEIMAAPWRHALAIPFAAQLADIGVDIGLTSTGARRANQ